MDEAAERSGVWEWIVGEMPDSCLRRLWDPSSCMGSAHPELQSPAPDLGFWFSAWFDRSLLVDPRRSRELQSDMRMSTHEFCKDTHRHDLSRGFWSKACRGTKIMVWVKHWKMLVGSQIVKLHHQWTCCENYLHHHYYELWEHVVALNLWSFVIQNTPLIDCWEFCEPRYESYPSLKSLRNSWFAQGRFGPLLKSCYV